jgi:hypothetical protein
VQSESAANSALQLDIISGDLTWHAPGDHFMHFAAEVLWGFKAFVSLTVTAVLLLRLLSGPADVDEIVARSPSHFFCAPLLMDRPASI